MAKLLRILLVVAMSSVQVLAEHRDILLELKGAYFLALDSCFREIYHNGGALYGPEITFQMTCHEHLYGFASVDYFSKHGESIGLCTPTKVELVPIGLGVKYLTSCRCADVYVGVGFQPTLLKTTNCSSDVAERTSKWGFGAIFKVGGYFALPCNFFADLFFSCSGAEVSCHGCQPSGGFVEQIKANVSGAIFGIGLGYRF